MEAITFSHGIRRLPGLAGLLGVDAIRWHLSASTAPAAPRDLVLGWRSKRNALRARCFATDHGLTYLSLEDGFLRSVKLGTSGATPYSLVVDDVGIYYDARYPSRLENLLNGEVLANLLEAVRRTYPEAYILYKPHPDVVSGNRAAGRMRPSMADYDQLIEDATLAAWLDAADEGTHHDLAGGLRGAVAGQEGGNLRPAVLRRLGTDRGPSCAAAPQPTARPGRTGGRGVAALPTLCQRYQR